MSVSLIRNSLKSTSKLDLVSNLLHSMRERIGWAGGGGGGGGSGGGGGVKG